MNREEFKNIIPHREPMLLVDEAELLENGLARGVYNVRGDEWFLKGHFPGNKVVPGVILLEMMAQASCVLVAKHVRGKTPYFTGIDRARFRQTVLPGDTLEIESAMIKERAPFYFAQAKGYVKGKLCVSAEFSFALADANNV